MCFSIRNSSNGWIASKLIMSKKNISEKLFFQRAFRYVVYVVPLEFVFHTNTKYLDSWIRRKLQGYRLKQCKRTITLLQFLKSSGVDIWQSWILALSGKGHWRKSGCRKCTKHLAPSGLTK